MFLFDLVHSKRLELPSEEDLPLLLHNENYWDPVDAVEGEQLIFGPDPMVVDESDLHPEKAMIIQMITFSYLIEAN